MKRKKRHLKAKRKLQPVRSLKLLEDFAWLCAEQYREILAVIRSDLQMDIRDMRRHGRGETFIELVTLWRVIVTIIPVIPHAFRTKFKRTPNGTATQNRKDPMRVLGLLEAFACFCSKENREIIQCVSKNLKDDATEMLQRHSERFVKCVLYWQVVVKTILPIVWDAICRLLSALVPIGKFISKFRGE